MAHASEQPVTPGCDAASHFDETVEVGVVERGDVVVVADESLLGRVRRLTRVQRRRVVGVPHCLAALGEAAQHNLDTLFVHANGADGLVEQSIEALEQLAPDASVCLIGEPGAAGPVPSPGDSVIQLSEQSLTDERIMSLLGVPAPQQREAGGETPPAQTQEGLGDVDLVEAMLTQGRSLEMVAAQLIAEQSGIDGVAVVRGDQRPPKGHASASIVFRGAALGVLHAPRPTSDEQLEPWAAWLARWLALDCRMRELHDLALRDDLTGAWNRRYFGRFLNRIVKRAEADRSQVTLMVFDIDDFKLYNDRYGHAAGDEILREASRLMSSVVREHDVVARIGGDEFAVIFWDAEGPRRPNSKHPQDVVQAARRFQAAICKHEFPKLLEQAPATLTISGGLASFPWDGRTAEELLERADAMALQSKRQGKNAVTLGPGAESQCAIKSL